jgi:hypothetical protein
MVLKPIPTVLANIPKGPALIKRGGLPVTVTLIPAALPPSKFLRTFRGHRRPAPAYPSSLADASLLEACNAQWDRLPSAAIASACHKESLLVATRNRGATCGLHEFDEGGRFMGSVENTFP